MASYYVLPVVQSILSPVSTSKLTWSLQQPHLTHTWHSCVGDPRNRTDQEQLTSTDWAPCSSSSHSCSQARVLVEGAGELLLSRSSSAIKAAWFWSCHPNISCWLSINVEPTFCATPTSNLSRLLATPNTFTWSRSSIGKPYFLFLQWQT